MVSTPAGNQPSRTGTSSLEIVSSLQNRKVRDAVRLHTSRGRKQQDRIIIFGTREIQRAITANVRLISLFVNSDSTLPSELNTNDIDLIHVTDAVFEKLSYGSRPDGIIAIAERPHRTLDQFRPTDGLILVAESIEKPGNLGAIFRTADATAAGGIIVSEPMCDLFHPNSIRNSTGTTFSVPSAVSTNDQTIEWLRDHDYRVLIATPDEADDLYEIRFNGRIAVVLGSEAHGLSETWMSGKFGRVRLPMNGAADSLNVSVTAAVIMYEALRQKQATN